MATNNGIAQLAERKPLTLEVVGSTPTPVAKPRGFASVGLFHPKDKANIGSVLRAAGCYSVALINIQGARYNRAATDTQAAYRHIPLVHVTDLRESIPYDCVPVAVELTEHARSLVTYKHPERAYYIFGPEDGTLGAKVLPWCRDIVYIPTRYCMNLAATVNVVLYDRLAKQERQC